MLFKKLWRTMGLYKAQFISMIIMIALGIGVFIGFNMEWVSIEENTNSFFEETGFADYRIVSETGFDKDDLKKVEKLDGIDKASRYMTVNAEVKQREGDSVALTVTENQDVSGCLLISGQAYDAHSKNGIWLSDKYAAVNEIQLNDELTLVYKNLEFKGKVLGMVKSGEHMICVRDETQLMPDYTTFGFAYISPAMYEDVVGTDFYPQINVISDLGKKEFSERVDKAFGETMMVLTKDETISYAEAQGEAEEGKTMGSVLPVLFLLIAVLTMVTTMHRLTAKEKTQIGTLKALGFKDKRILRHYSSYALMIALIGSALGLGLGYGIAWMVMNPDGMMGTYMDMPRWNLSLPWFCVAILIAIIVVLTLIGFLSVRKMLWGTAADALRPYTPKKMKRMLIERTGLWNKFGFGTQWNLRDIMRHKSRTLMSLIGIVGCMLIIVCAMGMQDTMDAYLDLYYDGATNYASRIYLAEDATMAQREALTEKYKGDWSASVSVQMGEKAISLDIYDVENDKVRFLDEDTNYIDLKDDGAYLCMRMADEFGLKVGDEFTISPYGSDDTYTLKVAGFDRSVSENIVILPEYADELGIPYTMDSIYTDTKKADIAADDAIQTVQSKQAIIDSFDTFIDLMNMMIVILIVAAIVLGVVVLYNLGVMSYTERYREMATLKVVGFKDKKIGRLLIAQNMWTALVGILLGLPAGIYTLNYMINALATEYEMKMVVGPMTYCISIVLTFGVSLVVSLMVARKSKKVDMVEALKGAE